MHSNEFHIDVLIINPPHHIHSALCMRYLSLSLSPSSHPFHLPLLSACAQAKPTTNNNTHTFAHIATTIASALLQQNTLYNIYSIHIT